MSLAFSGPGGAVERRWIVYALLRDNIQHHLEDGHPTLAFSGIHHLAEALGRGQATVNAKKLQAEMLRARDGLMGREIEELAISARTRSVLSMTWPPPQGRETMLLKDSGIELPVADHATQLDGVFGSLIQELISITDGASDSDVVQVTDL